ncbi:MAG: HipA domain-containing protein [Acidobacteriota bacterium]|nr:HipA domain-containing protein [Acidobacteriota bacterium]
MAQVSADKKKIVHGAAALRPGFEHWMIKFASPEDPRDIGAIEYAYSLMARDAGVEKAYALSCFNVLAHNRDDHAKNFSFLLSDGRRPESRAGTFKNAWAGTQPEESAPDSGQSEKGHCALERSCR